MKRLQRPIILVPFLFNFKFRNIAGWRNRDYAGRRHYGINGELRLTRRWGQEHWRDPSLYNTYYSNIGYYFTTILLQLYTVLYTGIMYWILMLFWVFLASSSLCSMLPSTSSIIMAEGGSADLQKTRIIWQAYQGMFWSVYKS